LSFGRVMQGDGSETELGHDQQSHSRSQISNGKSGRPNLRRSSSNLTNRNAGDKPNSVLKRS
jgi:hypothetical protein